MPSQSQGWAWFTLWYYPIFWLAHRFFGLLVAADALEVESSSPVVAAAPVVRGAVPTEQQLQKAETAVKADPNFATERKISTLHWSGNDEPSKSRFRWPGWLRWTSTAG